MITEVKPLAFTEVKGGPHTEAGTDTSARKVIAAAEQLQEELAIAVVGSTCASILDRPLRRTGWFHQYV